MKSVTQLFCPLLPLLLVPTLFLAGCQTRSHSPPEGDIVTPIGRIAYVYPREDIAIVRLHQSTRIPEDTLWMVENPVGRPTAMIRSTDMRRGRTVGFIIDDGLPNPGDSVFRKLKE
ncbi:MAG: hypothetical protein JJT75_03910 [Opitutales bacterium]|nr:hypothetical protein [Opitutales bacterium]MCH8540974.1 hypothetical protein [Opitutales bacterium]